MRNSVPALISKNKKYAFSLIELSIVIIVIGILITGIVQGKILIQKQRLQSARSLTISSPVAGIKGISFWFETSLESSFKTTEVVNEGPLTTWKDINPQKNIGKYFFVKSATVGAVYIENGLINSLPAVEFRVRDKGGQVAYDSTFSLSTYENSINNTIIKTPYDAFTIFLVLKKLPSSGINGYIFNNGGFNSSSITYALSSGKPSISMRNTGTISLGGVPSYKTDINATKIVSISYAGLTNGDINYYENGKLELSDNFVSTYPRDGNVFYLGSRDPAIFNNGRNWDGQMSEVIYYDHALKNKDRKSIEGYLSKKYNINIS